MILEFSNFLLVFGLMMIVMNSVSSSQPAECETDWLAKQLDTINGWEVAFIVYTCGWALDRFATTVCLSSEAASESILRYISSNMDGGSLQPIYGTVSTQLSSCESTRQVDDVLS